MTTMYAQNQSYLMLNNGVKMPQLGLGLYMIPDGDETYSSVRTALENGYRSGILKTRKQQCDTLAVSFRQSVCFRQ